MENRPLEEASATERKHMTFLEESQHMNKACDITLPCASVMSGDFFNVENYCKCRAF